MATVPEPSPSPLQDLAGRIGEIERAAWRTLAEAAALREGLRRAEAAAGNTLPVPPSPGHRHLSLVPPAA